MMGGAPASPSRPRTLVAVLGTATDIGKTWVCCALLRHARAEGSTVSARKPVQSYEPRQGHDRSTDADLLAGATGEPPEHVCPAHRWYPVPLAPPMAVEVLGLGQPTAGDLVGELVWRRAADLGLVETVGGVRSPVADDLDSAGLAALVQPDLAVVVADASLGTINAVRLSTALLGPLPTVVHLNRYDAADDLHRRNHDWLAHRDQLTVTTTIPELWATIRAIRGRFIRR